MTKAQIIESYKNDLTLMALENKKLHDMLSEVQREKAELYISNNELRKENELLRLQNINLLKRKI